MELYPHDCSYMRTEYAREQSIKSYDIEARRLGNNKGRRYGRLHYSSNSMDGFSTLTGRMGKISLIKGLQSNCKAKENENGCLL